MKLNTLKPLLMSAIVCLSLTSGHWAAAQNAAPTAISPSTRTEILKAVVDKMQSHYIFPDLVPQVQAAMADPERSKALAEQSSPAAFAEALTQTLQGVTRDKHVHVRYSEQPQPERVASGQPTAEEEAESLRRMQERNFGVERVERLPGNIGYLELRGFMSARQAAEPIAAAMKLLLHSEALIVDLRRNGGGDPHTVALLCSYLFDQRTHLNTLAWRDGTRDDFYTLDTLAGPRYGSKKPVYVLTSSRTFSGAEEFSYNLRNLKRATLVGETTGGGANPGRTHRLDAHFSMFFPNGRAISPVTGTSWEGTGVQPHIAVRADDALRVAQLKALAPLLAAATQAADQAGLRTRIAELEGAAPAAQ